MFEMIAFYLFALLTIVMFGITVFSSNALYALTSMAAGMIFIAAFFFLLDADFLGVIQIIVYTGAVMALYAFGMMFFDTTRSINEKPTYPRTMVILGMLAAMLVVVIVIAPIASNSIIQSAPIDPQLSNPQMVGMILFTKYLVPFELAAVMLLVAMVGGIVLAGKKMDVSLTLMREEEIAKTHMKKMYPHKEGGH